MSWLVDRKIAVLALLVLSNCAADADSVPVNFRRGGRPAALRVVAPPHTRGQLRAFGRTWSKAELIEQNKVSLRLPTVRVPTLFHIVESGRNRVLGEVVAYPQETNWNWPNGRTVFVSRSAPAWFREWMRTVGLPFQVATPPDAGALRRMSPQSPELWIVSGEAAGKSLRQLQDRFAGDSANVLVLSAKWFPQLPRRRVSVSPSRLRGRLATLREQQWPSLPSFVVVNSPVPALCNRESWIDGPAQPLVEAVLNADSKQIIVLSCLPWQQQLGRNELADMLFLEFLKASLHKRDVKRLQTTTDLIGPHIQGVDPRLRPVLAALPPDRKPLGKQSPVKLRILDLRGRDLRASDAQSIPPPVGKPGSRPPLLVLGTDPKAAGGIWSKKRIPKTQNIPNKNTPKDKRVAATTGVTWLPDDTLPPSNPQQIRLMRVLTQLGVRLSPPTKPK